MALDQTANFVNVEITGTYASSDTTIQLASGDASELPDPANGEYNLVWYDNANYVTPDSDPEVEIIRVTAVDTGNDTVTVTRGQEGTTAVAHDTSDAEYRFILASTSKMFNDIDAGNFSENAVTVAGNSVSLGGSTTVSHSDLSSIPANEHVDHSGVSISAGTHLTGGGDLTSSRTLNVDETGIDVENLSTQGSTGTVPVSQGDGSLAMQEVGGGLERISDLDGLVAYKQSFNSIRNRADWIDHIFQNNESMADEITNSQVLTHYVFESENDAYDRFIDPNHNLGLFAYNNDGEPTLSSVYEGAMFLAPTSFLEGLMTIESVADQITNSQVLMDAVHNGDAIMENNFGYEAGA